MLHREKIASFLNDLIVYLMIFPYLYPAGYTSYSLAYGEFFVGWMYVAVVVILLYTAKEFSKKVSYKKCLRSMALYYVVMILITLFAQGGFGEGLQKMFAGPAVCLVCMMLMKHDTRRFIKCLSNILLLNLALNLAVFNSIFFPNFFNPLKNGLMFVGHIQVGAQIGIVGLLLAYINLILEPRRKWRSRGLFILSIGTMLYSTTDASLIALIMIALSLIWIVSMKKSRFFVLDSRYYFVGYIIVNVLVLLFLSNNNWIFNTRYFSFNGRGLIWNAALNVIKKHKLFGYGVHGVLVHWMTWVKNDTGLNYLHNELLQVFIDGGIVLLIFYAMMWLSYLRNITNTINLKLRKYSNALLLAFFIVMTVESTSLYFYEAIFLSLLAYLPEISRLTEERERKNEQCFYIQQSKILKRSSTAY